MANIKLIMGACKAHGLAVEWRPHSLCYAVFRPLSPNTICLFDAIDVEDPESAAMEWAMMGMFDGTNPDWSPRYWRPV
jgi:hypothetical protein